MTQSLAQLYHASLTAGTPDLRDGGIGFTPRRICPTQCRAMHAYGLNRLIIGARGSPLSRAQTLAFRARLARELRIDPDALDAVMPIVAITTSGDRITGRTLQDSGGKGLFTKELDEALIEGRIDIAVHSMKDLPSVLPDGIMLAAPPAREDPRDALVCPGFSGFEALPPGARLGTASVRRRAQALALRPDLRISPLRGNVETRLAKIRAGEFDASFLAMAGLNRLGRVADDCIPLPVGMFLPAPCQGTLAITLRAEDADTEALLRLVADPDSTRAANAERAFLARLDGSCSTPVAALATRDADGLLLKGQILTPDGAQIFSAQSVNSGGAEGDAALGRTLAEHLLAAAGKSFSPLARTLPRPATDGPD